MSASDKELAALPATDPSLSDDRESGGAEGGATSVERPLPKPMQREVALYIGQMSAELSAMARKSDLDLLAYFLEMARVEARALVRRVEQGRVQGK